MISQQATGQSASPDSPTTPNLNLLVLATGGPDAIDTHGSPDIEKIDLNKLWCAHHNIFHQATAKLANNLFATGVTRSAQAAPISGYADPTSVSLTFHIRGSPAPIPVELVTPNVVKIPSTPKAPIIWAWLIQSALNASRTLARVALILVLAITTATAQTLDDNDGDDDDEDGDAERIYHRPCFTFHASCFMPGHQSQITGY